MLARVLWLLILCFCAELSAPTVGQTAARVALVVANAGYVHAPALKNPVNDGTDIAAALRDLDFEVIEGFDLTKVEMDGKIREFSQKGSDAKLVLFFYAGHGLQVDGENFLLPVDAQLEDRSSLDFETVKLDTILRNMQGPSQTALVFLDACRNNPLTRNLAQALGPSRALAVGRGLAASTGIEDGLFIAFSTAPDDVALDGMGRNSPFTKALLAHIRAPQVEIQQVMTRVKADVYDFTHGRQRPWHNSDLRREVYLAPGGTVADAGVAPIAALVNPPRIDLPTPLSLQSDEDFERAKRIGTARAWQLYIDKHKDDALRTAATRMLGQVEEVKVDSLSPAEAEKSLGLEVEQRTQLQLRLKELGFDPGNADGRFGKSTRNQIRAYQADSEIAISGYVDIETARGLGLQDLRAPVIFYASTKTRRYDPDDLDALETDSRIVQAAKCLRGREINYGAFGGHIYAVAYEPEVKSIAAKAVAKSCGAHLVSISSKLENDFIFGLISRDQKLFAAGSYSDRSFKTGPWLGLQRSDGTKSPKSGWTWHTGEKLTYSRWLFNQANQHPTDGIEYAMFYGEGAKDADPADVVADHWQGMEDDMITNSFIVEFE